MPLLPHPLLAAPGACPVERYSYNKLLKDFAAPAQEGALTLAVGGAEWIERGICRCAEPGVVQRFIPLGQGYAGRCARCRSSIRPQPFYTHRTVSASMLGKAATTPLSMLGVRQCPWVLLRNQGQAFLVQDPRRAMPMR